MFETIIVLLSIYIIVLFMKKGQPTLHSHWNTLLSGFQFSTKEFYKLVREELKSRGVENVSFLSKSHLESGALSTKRLYLRIKYKHYHYDCCFAKFGDSSFVSWWLVEKKSNAESLLERIPFIGKLLTQTFFPQTFYTSDTMSMFMTMAHNSVLKVIDDITKDSGVRTISDNERKPILSDVFKR